MDCNCKPIHAREYTVPRSVEQQLQKSKEIVRLVDIEVLEEDYSSEWASPSFAISKKSGTIRVVTDFRKNSTHLIIETPLFSMPKIGKSDMIRSMEGFTFDLALDLNMGYYHIKSDADSQNLFTIVFLWHLGKCKYKRLPWVSRSLES
jgi:hypothetical protein